MNDWNTDVVLHCKEQKLPFLILKFSIELCLAGLITIPDEVTACLTKIADRYKINNVQILFPRNLQANYTHFGNVSIKHENGDI